METFGEILNVNRKQKRISQSGLSATRCPIERAECKQDNKNLIMHRKICVTNSRWGIAQRHMGRLAEFYQLLLNYLS